MSVALVGRQILHHLKHEFIPFWNLRGWDCVNGGYQTTFDRLGIAMPESERFLYTHARQLWWFARAYEWSRSDSEGPDERSAQLAKQGYQELIARFAGSKAGTWHWKVTPQGELVDADAVLFGYSYVLLALSEYAIVFDDENARQLATETFSVIQTCFRDSKNGGYVEFLNRDLSMTTSPDQWCDRRSLDTAMHVLESFTRFYEAIRSPLHRDALVEQVTLLAGRMIDPQSGSGWAQFTVDYRPVQPIPMYKMWDTAKRKAAFAGPLDFVCYGHNVQLGWLLLRAIEAAEMSNAAHLSMIEGLLRHTVVHGYDSKHGGVYRYGAFAGPPTATDKDFWPQAEAMVGFLEGYRVFRDPLFLDAFLGVWGFVRSKLIVPGVGEWMCLVDEIGRPIDSNTGQVWKDAYHGGRALIESTKLLEEISS